MCESRHASFVVAVVVRPARATEARRQQQTKAAARPLMALCAREEAPKGPARTVVSRSRRQPMVRLCLECEWRARLAASGDMLADFR
ncbi:MAG: hypothetical protein INR71_05060 [Terriglobus roseus]|nr:hypothetical protein [Terriglobus roseus]